MSCVFIWDNEKSRAMCMYIGLLRLFWSCDVFECGTVECIFNDKTDNIMITQ